MSFVQSIGVAKSKHLVKEMSKRKHPEEDVDKWLEVALEENASLQKRLAEEQGWREAYERWWRETKTKLEKLQEKQKCSLCTEFHFFHKKHCKDTT